MKTRNGFVSNSSSSSFIIASKEPLTKKILEKKLGLENLPNFIFKNVVDGVVALLLGSEKDYEDIKEKAEDWEECNGKTDTIYHRILAKIDENWDVRSGYASNDGDCDELVLYNFLYNLSQTIVEDDDFIFWKE